MINSNDLYTIYFEQPLSIGGAKFGTVIFRYEVRQIINVQNLSQNLSYRIICTQRISIPNSNTFSLTPAAITAYNNYPALLSIQTNIQEGENENLKLKLLDYTPRTINTTIMTSANTSDGTNNSYSQQHTSGSSTSQTNTYGANISLGFFGDAPTGSFGADYSHSNTVTHEQSNSTGREQGANHDQASSESMSIKDWGSYAYLDLQRLSPTWIWGQEYPWDVIQFRSCPTNNNVDLPKYVFNRLFNTSVTPTIVSPPSQLSLFGIDFTMKASWQTNLPQNLDQQKINLAHSISYLSASHGLDTNNKNSPYVRLTAAPAGLNYTSPELDLTLLGLDPVPHGEADNGAVIGFSASKFIVPPSKGSSFKIISGSNNLQIEGAGFNSDMSTNFSQGAVSLIISFKIIDDIYQYSLIMKHWKSSTNGCTLRIICNGNDTGALIRHADDIEGAGGDNNLLAINLRNKDYSSIDYHDYLVMGLNTITITITPNGPDAIYQLRALAIGES